MASMPSCRVRWGVILLCSPFSTNEGLKDGPEGFIIPDCCDELLIWNVGVELLSILTDNSLLVCFLIICAMQVIISIAASEAPVPIRGHFMFSNSDVGSFFTVGFS